MAVFDHLPPMSHFFIFSRNPSLLCHLLKSDKLWKKREEGFYYKWLFKYDALHYIKRAKSSDIAVFEPIGVVIFLHAHMY